MTSKIPETIAKKAAELNETYNPLAEAKQPSEAHGKFTYAKGVVEQAVGEAAGSTPYITDGMKLKAQGAAEIQAARMGVTVEKWHDMVARGDFNVVSRDTQDTLEEIGRSTGNMIDGTPGGIAEVEKSMREQGKGLGVPGGAEAARGVEGAGRVAGAAGKGVGESVSDMGKGVGLGAREDV